MYTLATPLLLMHNHPLHTPKYTSHDHNNKQQQQLQQRQQQAITKRTAAACWLSLISPPQPLPSSVMG
jgi:hypothetical protein